MSFADDIVAFAANIVGVLLGALLGYLLGLRQQRKIDIERDNMRKNELVQALKAELRIRQSPTRSFSTIQTERSGTGIPTRAFTYTLTSTASTTFTPQLSH